MDDETVLDGAAIGALSSLGPDDSRDAAPAAEADLTARAADQHFWQDSNGAHVTEIEKDEWASSPSGHNILMNSLGILLRKALANLVSITESAVAFFDGEGNAAGNVTASFGPSGAVVGKESSVHTVVTPYGFKTMYGDDTLMNCTTNGITNTITFGGSTLASQYAYTDAEIAAIVRYLNSGCTVSGTSVLSPQGAETGYTLRERPGNYPTLRDSEGNSFESGSYSGIYYDDSGLFGLNIKMFAEDEIFDAPLVIKAGGVTLEISNGKIKSSGPIQAPSS